MPASALRTLASQLRIEDTVVSPHVTEPETPPTLGVLVAAGPAAKVDPAAYALVIESVREGYLLHYGVPRVIVGAESDLRLLAGDYLYALGLERLAGLGDLPAVRQLSDLISLGAQLHADAPTAAAATAQTDTTTAQPTATAATPQPAAGATAAPAQATRPDPAGEALWLASTMAIATGDAAGMDEAKFALRAGNPGAQTALEAAAASMATRAGLADSLAQAAHSIHFRASDPPDLG